MNERPYAAVYCKDDARWLELVDAQAEGEFLTAADHQFLEAHQAVHPDVRAEQEIWHSLRAFDPSLIAVTRDDDALISAAVEAFLAAPMISDAHDEAPEADAGGQVVELFAKPSFLARWRAPTLWAGAGAAVAASVMFVLLTGSGRQDASTIAPQVAQANSQVGDAPSTATASDREFGFTGEKSELLAQAVVPSGLVVVSGHGSQNGKALRKRSSIARTGQEIQVAETMCIAANDAQEICLEQGSRALVRANSLELLSGRRMIRPICSSVPIE